jgi:hypothetical protein
MPNPNGDGTLRDTYLAIGLGPEFVLDAPFAGVSGEVGVKRAGAILWQKQIASGEQNMCHSLVNREHHHFKFDSHRQPGHIHIHFYEADVLSFGEGIVLAEGDITEVRFAGFGRALRNPIREEVKLRQPVRVHSLA